MKLLSKALIISALFLGLLTTQLSAQGVPTEGLVRIKGKATIKYDGIFRAGSPERRIAMDKALVSCIDRYMSMLPKSRYEIFLKHALSTVEKNPAPYVGAITIVKEHTDKTTKTFDITVEAEVNAAKLNALLEAMLPKGNLSEEDAFMAFVAMARYLEKKVIAKDTERRFELFEATKEKAIQEGNKLGLKGEELNSHVNEQLALASEKTTGGDTTKRAPVNVRNVESVGSMDAAILKVFTEAKFEVIDAGDLDVDLDKFKADFAKDGQASAATRRAAYKLCTEEGIKFFIVATMDVHLPEIDKATGLTAVTCFVTAKVYQLRPSKTGKRVLGLTKASMSGNPFKGLGPNDDVAKQNAINRAAKETAEILRDQLRAKGLTP